MLAELEEGFGRDGLTWSGGGGPPGRGGEAQGLSRYRALPSGPEGVRRRASALPDQGLNWLQFLREYVSASSPTTWARQNRADPRAPAAGKRERPHGPAQPGDRAHQPDGELAMEAQRFAPRLRVLVLQGPERKQRFEDWPDTMWCSPLIRCCRAMRTICWRRSITC